MGNRSRALMIALGVFFVGVAALARFYGYPALAVAPADQTAETVSSGPGATIFSIAELKEKTGVDLEARRTVRGDVVAAEKISKALDRDVVVFDTAVTTDDSKNYQFPDDPTNTKDLPLSFVQERVVLDAHTGEAVPWNPSGDDNSGEYITTTFQKEDRLKPDPASPLFKGHEGLVLKFPFGTEKKSYRFWDSSTRKAFPIDFKGEEKLYGLKVYRFEQVVPKQDLPLAKPLMVPGNLVGAPGTDAVEVQRTYTNTRTLWIEPVTGAIIKGQEQQLATIAYQGEDKLTATQVTIAYTDDTVKKNVNGVKIPGTKKIEGDYKSKSAQLNLLGFWVPLIGFSAGAILLALTAFLSIGRRARRAAS